MPYPHNKDFKPSKWAELDQIFTEENNGKTFRISASYPEENPERIYLSIWRMIKKEGGNPFPTKDKKGNWINLSGISFNELSSLIDGLREIQEVCEKFIHSPKEENPEPEPEPESEPEKVKTKEEDVPF